MKEALLARRDDPLSLRLFWKPKGNALSQRGGILPVYDRQRLTGILTMPVNSGQMNIARNTLIDHYPKPYIAFLHGFVMGGGVGIACHGSHRIVCETAGKSA